MHSDDGWQHFVKQFAESVRHITGQNLQANLGSEDRETILQEELESARTKADKLGEEVIMSLRLLDRSHIVNAVYEAPERVEPASSRIEHSTSTSS